jgi:hypothetical protein
MGEDGSGCRLRSAPAILYGDEIAGALLYRLYIGQYDIVLLEGKNEGTYDKYKRTYLI